MTEILSTQSFVANSYRYWSAENIVNKAIEINNIDKFLAVVRAYPVKQQQNCYYIRTNNKWRKNHLLKILVNKKIDTITFIGFYPNSI